MRIIRFSPAIIWKPWQTQKSPQWVWSACCSTLCCSLETTRWIQHLATRYPQIHRGLFPVYKVSLNRSLQCIEWWATSVWILMFLRSLSGWKIKRLHGSKLIRICFTLFCNIHFSNPALPHSADSLPSMQSLIPRLGRHRTITINTIDHWRNTGLCVHSLRLSDI